MNTNLLPATEERVQKATNAKINARIQNQIRKNVAHYANASQQEIDRRIWELDREWDIERVLETAASANILATLTLGTFVNRRWYYVSAAVAAFLLQHALQGWCPPIPVLRRLGVRTTAEINEEKTTLRLLRGDFQQADPHEDSLARFEKGIA